MNMNGAKHVISNRKPTKNSCFFRPWFTSKNVAPLIRFQATMFHREILQYLAKNADMSDPVGHHRSTNKKKVLPSNNLIWQRNILPSYPSRGEGKFPDICVNCEDAGLDFQGKNINHKLPQIKHQCPSLADEIPSLGGEIPISWQLHPAQQPRQRCRIFLSFHRSLHPQVPNLGKNQVCLVSIQVAIQMKA